MVFLGFVSLDRLVDGQEAGILDEIVSLRFEVLALEFLRGAKVIAVAVRASDEIVGVVDLRDAFPDLDLVATEKQNAFAIAQYADVMTIEKFARHIATHGCVYSRADISAILYLAVDCMREQLLEGKKIRLGDLGDFSINLTSKGADTADKFSAQNITGVNVVWDPGMEFKSLLADAEFNLVASRNAQAALLKAIKAGQNVVTSPSLRLPRILTTIRRVATTPAQALTTPAAALTTPAAALAALTRAVDRAAAVMAPTLEARITTSDNRESSHSLTNQ